MKLEGRAVRPKQGLVPAQQNKSYIRTATKPVIVVDKLRTPNPMPHDMPLSSRADTAMDKQRKLQVRYGSAQRVYKTLKLGR